MTGICSAGLYTFDRTEVRCAVVARPHQIRVDSLLARSGQVHRPAVLLPHAAVNGVPGDGAVKKILTTSPEVVLPLLMMEPGDSAADRPVPATLADRWAAHGPVVEVVWVNPSTTLGGAGRWLGLRPIASPLERREAGPTAAGTAGSAEATSTGAGGGDGGDTAGGSRRGDR